MSAEIPLPQWYTRLPLSILIKKCTAHQLDPTLVAAICQKESSGNTWAVRFEPEQEGAVLPGYPHYSMVAGCSPETEKRMEQSSWGLMQVMGWIARKYGFTHSMPRLCDPEFGLEYGCRLLSELMKRYSNNEPAVISAYNHGSARVDTDGAVINDAYVASVSMFLKQLRGDLVKSS